MKFYYSVAFYVNCTIVVHSLHKREFLYLNIYTVGWNGKTTECDITRCNCLSIYVRVCG